MACHHILMQAALAFQTTHNPCVLNFHNFRRYNTRMAFSHTGCAGIPDQPKQQSEESRSTSHGQIVHSVAGAHCFCVCVVLVKIYPLYFWFMRYHRSPPLPLSFSLSLSLSLSRSFWHTLYMLNFGSVFANLHCFIYHMCHKSLYVFLCCVIVKH
jgi:hypothetical protein